ncbi:hypothetical protein Tco_0015009 [Tanacetum coccineum]
MECVEKINEARVDECTTHLKSLNIVYETPEADSAPKATMLTMAETNTTTSGNITGLTKHLRNANLLEIITQLDAFHTSINSLNSQCASISESLKEDLEFNACHDLMSSSSVVTYTSVYSDLEPWSFQWVSDDELEALNAVPQSPGHAP